ncbi:MAG: S-sulfosulfanyl-L-cysteine sulfohydrolase [Pseudomonadota bacterium]|nr:S-sulfosulfanyl-L-cysteine sulfohydrolase [Pseudomonadota bacterium]
MSVSRREFIQLISLAGAAGLLPGSAFARQQKPSDLYETRKFGNVTLLHFTDCHAQLMPIHFREPSVNIGVGGALGKPPHLVGNHFLKHFSIGPDSMEAHAFTYLNFSEAAQTYGKVGGFAHLATLIKRVRAERGAENCLLLDGGDTWQGSATSVWTRGMDMVGACNLLGVDVMTGHWEFTYHEKEILQNLQTFKGEFLAQNIRVKDEAVFEGAAVFDENTNHAFRPYTIRQLNGVRVAIIGQSFPYTPIANPARFIPNWSFGISDETMQEIVNEIRRGKLADLIVVLSHNGMDVDLKLASRVSGIDVIFGGHTHDAMPAPVVVKNKSGQTLVTNAGSNGKFLAVMDFDVRGGKLRDYRYRMLPVFSNLLPADRDMQAYVEKIRQPYLSQLNEKLSVADELLYRRGNFNGTFDQIICDALRAESDAQISLSPGFRWGTTVLPGQAITMEHVMDQTATTYPETYVREMTGAEIREILEDVADNLFNKDPYYQQGGDMVRLGGMDYVMDPDAGIGNRISSMTLDNGQLIEAAKVYKVAGWATVNSQAPGRPVWDIVADYLRSQPRVKLKKLNTPRLANMAGNPGLA